MTVTPEFIEQGKSAHGGWSKRQLAILGVQWPPQPGWKPRAIGREIAQAEANEFLRIGEGKEGGTLL